MDKSCRKNTRTMLSEPTQAVYQEKVTKESEAKPVLTFGVISDIHLSGDETDLQRQINLRNALTYYKKNNIKLLIVNGDLSNTGTIESYQEFNSIFKEIFMDDADAPETILILDNHEYYDGWPWVHKNPKSFSSLQKRFMDNFNLKTLNQNKLIDGYHFIAVCADGMEGTYASYTEDTMNWLKQQLNEATTENPNRPIFVNIHQPPLNTVCCSSVIGNGNPYLDSILSKYSQIICFTSHTHDALQDEKSIYQKNYTIINSASLWYVGVDDDNTYQNVDNGCAPPDACDFGQGLFVTVTNTMISISRQDFYNNEKIKDDWSIDVPIHKSEFKYTDSRISQRSEPFFPKNSKITFLYGTPCTIEFPSAKDSDFVYHYRIEIINQESNEVISQMLFVSDFYKGLNRMSETQNFKMDINGLEYGANYQLNIYAVDSFGIAGKPLSKNFTI